VLENAFDPFFTTKEPGEGTGSAFRRSTASPNNRVETAQYPASQGKGALYGFICRATLDRGTRLLKNPDKSRRAASVAVRSSLSKTMRMCGLS
jgi:hypothetical protein